MAYVAWRLEDTWHNQWRLGFMTCMWHMKHVEMWLKTLVRVWWHIWAPIDEISPALDRSFDDLFDGVFGEVIEGLEVSLLRLGSTLKHMRHVEDPIGRISVSIDKSTYKLSNGGVSDSIEGFETVVLREEMVLRWWRLLTMTRVLYWGLWNAKEVWWLPEYVREAEGSRKTLKKTKTT